MIPPKKPFLFLAFVSFTDFSWAADKDVAGRNGEVEAISHFKSNKPLTIYTHSEAGSAVTWSSPGIDLCSPSQVSWERGGSVFRIMNAAAFQENAAMTAKKMQIAVSALRFALAYNTTVFRLRKAEVKKLCPNARSK